jgi:hypothetical protein
VVACPTFLEAKIIPSRVHCAAGKRVVHVDWPSMARLKLAQLLRFTVGSNRIGLITVPKKKGRYKVIVGIDLDHHFAHNLIGYLRFADTKNKNERGISKTVGRELWLTLEDMDKLGTLLVLYSRFWAKTRHKGQQSRNEARAFARFWKILRREWPTLQPFIPGEE